MTSASTIKSWFERAEQEGADYMVVVCDSYDYTDYPVYCDAEKARKTIAKPGDMQRVMEVYDIRLGWDAQSRGRVWNAPKDDRAQKATLRAFAELAERDAR